MIINYCIKFNILDLVDVKIYLVVIVDVVVVRMFVIGMLFIIFKCLNII